MDLQKERYLRAKRALFDRVYEKRLNAMQRSAVFTAKGPLLVLAGAGSGKTTVLVNRISYLIKYGNAYFDSSVPEDISEGLIQALENARDLSQEEILQILPEFISEPAPPWSVLAITFTNKAAREIKERLLAAFSDRSVTDSVWTGTFHSVCLRILRKYGERLGYRQGFSIYDTDDKKRMITLAMKELSIDEKRLNPKVVAGEISRAKDNLLPPQELRLGQDPREGDIVRIYSLYQKKMMEYNALDFDDIIMQTVKLLQTDEEVRLYYQNKFRYVLVDEYQDTNYAQFVLCRILADLHRNIMVVGDDDQSIYRFRGATVENILSFDKTYPDATVVKLEENYRSTENILNAANAVIGNNLDRHQKTLWSRNGEGEKIAVHEAADQSEEGKYIISEIARGVREEGRRYSDYAVLYRVNELARSLETVFAKSALPYRILGSMRFYDRKEIKDMLAYLSVINSPADSLRLKRIINEPKRKIGTATVETVEQISQETGLSMYEVMSRSREFSAIGKSAEKLQSFVSLIDGFRDLEILPSALIEKVFSESGYKDMLEGEGFEGEGKINNVNELISAAVEYEKRCADTGSEVSLSVFLEELSLISDIDKYDEEADAVVLMTVHAAKGLEFPIVFLAGAEDGIFPSVQNMCDPSEMSEERRLMYVAITRAKEKFCITHAKSRTMYGRTGYNQLSVFVREEIPSELIARRTARSVPPRSRLGYSPSERARPYQPPAELRRPSDIFPSEKRRSGAESWGIEKFEVGTRVNHSYFGNGAVVASRDMGGDVFYEVRFDSGETKKFMATVAKLKKI